MGVGNRRAMWVSLVYMVRVFSSSILLHRFPVQGWDDIQRHISILSSPQTVPLKTVESHGD
jgi:hypothetical protein